MKEIQSKYPAYPLKKYAQKILVATFSSKISTSIGFALFIQNLCEKMFGVPLEQKIIAATRGFDPT
jgi:hypothetical protein